MFLDTGVKGTDVNRQCKYVIVVTWDYVPLNKDDIYIRHIIEILKLILTM